MVAVVLGIGAIIVAWIIGYFAIPNTRTYVVTAIIVTVIRSSSSKFLNISGKHEIA